ncbi:hypothetical protein SARC_15293 [Sphaeroforma arctica JP610]|uniref:Uncharacterized protein n=1 Tax=Sphaeroforma arctica JP610 TaxID=667725 RepID=A0A0L0F609_9EUKA|nr:hypothetical protein SARC_15293 [Sphaeroforma arctica JP610]KNC72155.1 hypothetical protein SARC_15293 [Sphaeroforma arctica JP610]|eukprot:XP_014146057.1 hypothetical protein SARC_15293 [Sphaeroforma arctica JP610]
MLPGDYVIHTLIGHEGSISCVAFGSRALVTGSEDRTARVWDLATGLVVASLEGHEEMVTSVRMFEDAEVAKVIPGMVIWRVCLIVYVMCLL